MASLRQGEGQSLSFAIRKGSVPAAVTAVVATIIFGPAEAVTELLVLIQIFVLTIAVLAALSRLVPVRGWTQRAQRRLIWSVAVGTAALVCFEPVLFGMLFR
jgi:hypothetical protein